MENENENENEEENRDVNIYIKARKISGNFFLVFHGIRVSEKERNSPKGGYFVLEEGKNE